VAEAYAGFGHAAVAPLKQLDERSWLLELFHGPTLAFKDYRPAAARPALRPRAGPARRARHGDRRHLRRHRLGGHRGLRDRAQVDIFMLHPKGRVSEVQRRQMTTVLSSNVHNIAIEGTFDDCQDLVKAMFNDLASATP
jgi:threonine synthase